jgi:NADPH:quinone reductase-like Zn-dependent oxidoreductase
VDLPFVPGSDICGVVESVGAQVSRVKPGDSVLAYPARFCHQCDACLAGRQNHCRHYAILGENSPGGCCDEILLPERNLFPLPAGLSFEQGAALPLAWLTSWHMLTRKVSLHPGDWVLIQAAASGTGVAALQIARLFGARVIATASSEDKCARLTEMGAEVVVQSGSVDLKAAVRAATMGRGCAVVLDHQGEDTFSVSLACLARGGSYVTCGGTTGPLLSFDVRHLFIKHQQIVGSTMGDVADFQSLLTHVGPPPAGGFGVGLWPVLHRVFPLREIGMAHAELESRRVVGKVVVSLEN